eukprot:tig00021135_g18931.t1
MSASETPPAGASQPAAVAPALRAKRFQIDLTGGDGTVKFSFKKLQQEKRAQTETASPSADKLDPAAASGSLITDVRASVDAPSHASGAGNVPKDVPKDLAAKILEKKGKGVELPSSSGTGTRLTSVIARIERLYNPASAEFVGFDADVGYDPDDPFIDDEELAKTVGGKKTNERPKEKGFFITEGDEEIQTIKIRRQEAAPPPKVRRKPAPSSSPASPAAAAAPAKGVKKKKEAEVGGGAGESPAAHAQPKSKGPKGIAKAPPPPPADEEGSESSSGSDEGGSGGGGGGGSGGGGAEEAKKAERPCRPMPGDVESMLGELAQQFGNKPGAPPADGKQASPAVGAGRGRSDLNPLLLRIDAAFSAAKSKGFGTPRSDMLRRLSQVLGLQPNSINNRLKKLSSSAPKPPEPKKDPLEVGQEMLEKFTRSLQKHVAAEIEKLGAAYKEPLAAPKPPEPDSAAAGEGAAKAPTAAELARKQAKDEASKFPWAEDGKLLVYETLYWMNYVSTLRALLAEMEARKESPALQWRKFWEQLTNFWPKGRMTSDALKSIYSKISTQRKGAGRKPKKEGEAGKAAPALVSWISPQERANRDFGTTPERAAFLAKKKAAAEAAAAAASASSGPAEAAPGASSSDAAAASQPGSATKPDAQPKKRKSSAPASAPAASGDPEQGAAKPKKPKKAATPAAPAAGGTEGAAPEAARAAAAGEKKETKKRPRKSADEGVEAGAEGSAKRGKGAAAAASAPAASAPPPPSASPPPPLAAAAPLPAPALPPAAPPLGVPAQPPPGPFPLRLRHPSAARPCSQRRYRCRPPKGPRRSSWRPPASAPTANRPPFQTIPAPAQQAGAPALASPGGPAPALKPPAAPGPRTPSAPPQIFVPSGSQPASAPGAAAAPVPAASAGVARAGGPAPTPPPLFSTSPAPSP